MSRHRIPVVYSDEEDPPPLRLAKFIGYSMYGDQGDMPLNYSRGGYGFDTADERIMPTIQDSLIETLTPTVLGAAHDGQISIGGFAFYTRTNSASGLSETFLIISAFTKAIPEPPLSPGVDTYGYYVRYLPRDSLDTSYSTAWSKIGDCVKGCDISDFVNYQDGTQNIVILATNGHALLKWAGTYTDGVPDDLEVLNASAPDGAYLAICEDRLMVAGIPGYPNTVRWSQSADPDGWVESSTGAGYKNIVQGRGDAITALSATRYGLIIAKKGSSHRLYGNVPTDFQFSLISEEYGVVNNNCIAEAGNLIVVLDKYGLTYFDGSYFRPFMREALALDIFSETDHAIPNEGYHRLFTFNDRLYLNVANTCLYKINPYRKTIESVFPIADSSTGHIYLPMNTRCVYSGRNVAGSGAAIRGLNDNLALSGGVYAPTYNAMQWIRPETDLGNSFMQYTLRKIRIHGKGGTCRVTPKSDGVVGTQVSVELPVTEGYADAYIYARGKKYGYTIDNGTANPDGGYDPIEICNIDEPYSAEAE